MSEVGSVAERSASPRNRVVEEAEGEEFRAKKATLLSQIDIEDWPGPQQVACTPGPPILISFCAVAFPLAAFGCSSVWCIGEWKAVWP